MPPANRFLIGVFASAPVTLVVKFEGVKHLPTIVRRSRDGSRAEADFPPGAKEGTVELPSGAHVLEMHWADERLCHARPVPLCVKSDSGATTTFVGRRTTGAVAARVLASAVGGNPKDPWPPPLAKLASDVRTWFADNLPSSDAADLPGSDAANLLANEAPIPREIVLPGARPRSAVVGATAATSRGGTPKPPAKSSRKPRPPRKPKAPASKVKAPARPRSSGSAGARPGRGQRAGRGRGRPKG